MTPDWDCVCRELLLLASRKDCRQTDWSASIPCDWAPSTVWDPRFDREFTEQGAWLYVIELLESGHEFTPKTMRQPPNTIAYETIIELRPSLPKLYIKLQIHKGKILGRSFHNVTK